MNGWINGWMNWLVEEMNQLILEQNRSIIPEKSKFKKRRKNEMEITEIKKWTLWTKKSVMQFLYFFAYLLSLVRGKFIWIQREEKSPVGIDILDSKAKIRKKLKWKRKHPLSIYQGNSGPAYQCSYTEPAKMYSK